MFSFGENLFRPNSKAVESFKYLTLNRIFLESDEQKGGVKRMYGKGAELKNIPLDLLKRAAWVNFNRVFFNQKQSQTKLKWKDCQVPA